MIDLPLMPIPQRPYPGWQAEFDRVTSDQYVARKYNRAERIAEKLAYIEDHCPEVKQGGGAVLDLGPGPGEYLEICRHFGNHVAGIDAPTGDGGMGNEYLLLSELMCQRQRITVWRNGLLPIINGESPLGSSGSRIHLQPGFSLINSQGSIEQCFAHRMVGTPHHVHKNCRLLAWKVDDELRAEFRQMMERFHWLLRPGGAVLIYANGAANTPEYTREIKEAADAAGLKLVREDVDGRLHRWERPQ